MKIRLGFVSNSSSSSFLAILSKEDYDKIVKSLGPVGQAVLEQTHPQKKEFAGQECVLHYHITGNYSTFEYMDGNAVIDRAHELASEQNVLLSDEYDDDEQCVDFLWEDLYEILSKFENQIYKLEKSGKAITHGEDL